MRIKEKGHNVPHVHATKAGSTISISFEGVVIAGKLKNTKDEIIATRWVIQNREFLEKKWKELH